MSDPFRNYDRWKLMSPEDEEDERDRKAQRDYEAMERADDMNDRNKDDRAQGLIP